MKAKTVLRVAAIVFLLAVLAPCLASACPLCKDAMPDAPGATSVWRGMYWSILFMVSAPFTMVVAMIVMVRRARRNLPGRGLASTASARPGSVTGRPLPEPSGERL
ncbi:MAG TPA: hypothetical protein VGK26_12315 [Thermoanaerobaculia bacterium]